MTDTKQPEALRLADAIDPPQIACLPETRAIAATELRRLHEENETLKKCLFQMQNAAIELAKPEQPNSIWILTREINQYDQDGEYFVGAWNQKPTHQMLAELGVPQNRLRKVLDGGGRVYPEEEWFYLKEQK